MLKKVVVCVALSIATCMGAGAQINNAGVDNSVEARAARFFHYKEWISAGAMYTMLLGEDPANAIYCGRAIVAAGMLGDTIQQASLTNVALNAHMPVDSLFASVERTSFSVGQTSLYEQYLLQTKANEPWLARIVDSYLMKYYTYRRYPEGMIEYSKIMLKGSPENEQFLYTLAQGYLVDGKTQEALSTYRHIVEINPESLDALLYLANYYYQNAASDSVATAESLVYFLQARNIKGTPYIDSAISRLQHLQRIQNRI